MIEIMVKSMGWIGMASCTLGYFLLSLKVIKAESRSYQFLNIIGGLCLMAAAIKSNDASNAAANLLWMLIGIYSYVKQLKIQRTLQRGDGTIPKIS